MGGGQNRRPGSPKDRTSCYERPLWLARASRNACKINTAATWSIIPIRSASPGITSVAQVSVRFAWLSGSVRSSSSKRLRFGCLRTLVTRHMQRIANYRLLHLLLAKHPRDRFQVGLPAYPIEREQRLGHVPKRIRNRDPNAPVPHVEVHESKSRSRSEDARNKAALLLLL